MRSACSEQATTSGCCCLAASAATIILRTAATVVNSVITVLHSPRRRSATNFYKAHNVGTSLTFGPAFDFSAQRVRAYPFFFLTVFSAVCTAAVRNIRHPTAFAATFNLSAFSSCRR